MKRALLLAVLGLALPARADEGLWLYNQPPLSRLKEAYGFKPDRAWLENLRLASTRFNSRGSGAFVSANGLVATNWHVISDYVPPEGFFGRGERKCPNLRLSVLLSIQDVTAGVLRGPSRLQATRIRALQSRTSRVISLFHGKRYFLYRYRRYNDIRLVFGPERELAYLGGERANFGWPRHSLDFALVRVYSDGKPVHPEHYLRCARGVSAGELVLVSGNPAHTERGLTAARLSHLRDEVLPRRLRERRRSEARAVGHELFLQQNNRKYLELQLHGLAESLVPKPIDYPDATFSLRLSFGRVDPKSTTLADLYRVAIHLPSAWRAARSRLDLRTPLNFATTADMSDGSSGSPVVNRRGQLVGLLFDMNAAATVWYYAYSERKGRSLAVDMRAVRAALSRVYHATDLLRELYPSSKA